MAFVFTIMGDNMRVTGGTINGMAWAMNALAPATLTKGSMSTGKERAREFTHGRMAISMKESSERVSNTVMERGQRRKVNVTRGSGRETLHMGTAFTHGQMATDTRASGASLCGMARAQTPLQMVTFTSVNMSWALHTDRAATNGRMETHTRAHLRRAKRTGAGFG